MLNTTIYGPDGSSVLEDVETDFVSYVNADTHGPPALVAPFKGATPTAQVGDSVLYINTSVAFAWEIERVSDR